MTKELNLDMVYLAESDRHAAGVAFLQVVIADAEDDDLLDREYADAAIYVVSQTHDHSGRLFKN